MPIVFKVCAGPCGASKPHTEFWKDAQETDGRMKRCIECVKAARRERSERRAAGEVVPVVSEELRQQRSENAKRLHAEGRLGGAQFARMADHSKRKRRINDLLLEWAREHPELVVGVLERNLRSKNRAAGMRALEHLSKIEVESEKLDITARGAGKAPEEMAPDELREFVEQGIRAQLERGEITIEQLTGVITLPDSDVVSVET